MRMPCALVITYQPLTLKNPRFTAKQAELIDMAKGKNVNPADAFRKDMLVAGLVVTLTCLLGKSQRKKELKKVRRFSWRGVSNSDEALPHCSRTRQNGQRLAILHW